MDDLNPENVGFVSFWNIFEQGGLPPSELNWADVLQNDRIIDYVPYDNGLIINWNSDAGQHPGHFVRLKTDGWMVAYTRTDVEGSYDGTNAEDEEKLDYGNTYDPYPMSDAPTTLCNLSPYWWDYKDSGSSVTPLHKNLLNQSISSLVADLSNSENVSFEYSDIGFFDFIFGADTYSLFGMQNEGGSQSAEANTLSESTTIHACHTGGGASTTDGSTANIYVNGNLEGEGGAGASVYFTKDMSEFFAQDRMISMELEGGDGEGCRGVIVIPWSDS